MLICLSCGEVYPKGETICESCESREETLLDWEEANTELRSAAAICGEGTEPGEAHTPTNVMAEEFVSAPAWANDAEPCEDTPIVSRTKHISTGKACVPSEGFLLDGRYLLGKQIGIGGYGAVFAATDERLHKRVAVKVLSPAIAQHPTALARFRQEAIAASRAQHENIIEIFDFCVDPTGMHFSVMEFLDGRDLADEIRQHGPLAPFRALAIVAQCAAGLAKVHEEGTLHRDLKPSNIFLTRRSNGQEVVKIIDFGISKITRGRGKVGELTSASVKVGTPFYMAPEQAEEAEPSGLSDVYSLGVILFEMLTGKRPFAGKSPLEVFEKHGKAERPLPSALQSGLAECPELDSLVVRAMAIDAGQRPGMAGLHDEATRLMPLASSLEIAKSDTPGPSFRAASNSEVERALSEVVTTENDKPEPVTLALPEDMFRETPRKSRSWWPLPVAGAAALVLGILAFSGSPDAKQGEAGAAPEGALPAEATPAIVAPSPSAAPEAAVESDPVAPKSSAAAQLAVDVPTESQTSESQPTSTGDEPTGDEATGDQPTKDEVTTAAATTDTGTQGPAASNREQRPKPARNRGARTRPPKDNAKEKGTIREW